MAPSRRLRLLDECRGPTRQRAQRAGRGASDARVRHRRHPRRRARRRARSSRRWPAEMAHRGPGRAADLERRPRRAGVPPAGDHRPRRALQPAAASRALHLVFNGEIYNYIELRERAARRSATSSAPRATPRCCCTPGRSGARARSTASTACSRSRSGTTPALADARRRPVRREAALLPPGRRALLFASDVRALRAADAAIGIPDDDALRDTSRWRRCRRCRATFFADVRRLPGGPRRALPRRRADAAPLLVAGDRRRAARPGRGRGGAARAAARLGPAAVAQRRARGHVADRGRRLVGDRRVSAELAGEHRRHAFTATFDGFARDEWRYASTRSRRRPGVEHHARPADARRAARRPRAARPRPGGAVRQHEHLRAVARDGGGARGRRDRAARRPGRRRAVRRLPGQRRLGAGDEGLRARWRRSRATAGWRGRSPSPTSRAARRRALAARYRLRRASPYVLAEAARAAAATPAPAPTWAVEGSPLRRALLSQTFRSSLPKLLRYADRNSMAHSIEVRLPFLDRRDRRVRAVARARDPLSRRLSQAGPARRRARPRSGRGARAPRQGRLRDARGAVARLAGGT